MKTIYITENQRNELEKSTSKTGRWSMMLNEETGTDRKKVMKIIADNCNRTYCKPYLMTPLSDVPNWLHDMCNPEGQEQGAWVSVKNNQHGMNRFIDFLVLNLKGQVGISHGNGPDKYIVGIARILCQDLGFYSFGENMNGGGIIKFSKLMKMIDKMPEFMLDGEELDKDLNGMSYGEIMQKFAGRMEAYVNGAKERLRQYNGGGNHHYRVVPINDTVNHQGMVTPDANGRNMLDMLDRYTDWCVCGQNGLWEYSQYLSNGGKLYILMRDGFENVPREQGENCPLDEYGLSLIALIVGADGLPDNVTTRWNHEFGGENHNNMWNAEQIQELTGINYLQTFKPRNRQQLMQMHLAESKIPSAQDQVHNKVNAGIMDAVTGGGMMEEAIDENSNDRKVNKYIKEKFGLTDFQDIRNKVMEIYEKIPYARIGGGRYMLGVLRLLFEENLPREDYGVLNKILYKIGNSNYYERQQVNDSDLGGWNFEQLKEKYFVPDFEGDKFSTSEKIVKLPNGYTVTRIDSYDEMNARCDGEWCISYDEDMWYELIPNETAYLVENEELINKFDEAMENKEFAENFENISYAAGEEDEMDEMGLINSDLAWTNKLGSWKFPYDIYGLSRFVVLVGEKYLSVYSRYNMPNEFDGDYLNKEQLEKLLGVKFTDVFKYMPVNKSYGHYDNYGRWRVDAVPTAVNEGKDSDYNFPKRVAKLKNGEIVLHNDFDFEHYYTGIEGINYISKDKSLVSKKWFDGGTKFDYWNDYAIVYDGEKENLLDRNGHLLLKKWYDKVCMPRKDGAIKIKDGSKINYAGIENGNPISKIWFDEIFPFKKINGKTLAIVRVGNKYNYINETFKLINKSWADSIGTLDIVTQTKRASKKFDEIKKISDSLLKVKKDGKFGIANAKGKLLTFDWYDRIGEYMDGRAIVVKDGKFNYITEKGNIISDEWFDNAYEFIQGTAIVVINGKQYTIDLNGKVINISEGAEPEADEYKIGGEGGNNEYFHAVNESIEMHSADDYTPMMRSIAEFMKNDGLNVYPYPKIRLNWDEQDGLFIKTGYYEPESKTIVIFCKDRHPKDILRTYAHEMIHHSQNLDGVDLNFSSEDDVKDNERLEEIESEAYLKGNVYFRKWTEYAKKDSKDILQEGKYSKWLIQLMQRRNPDGIENLSEATDPDDIDLSSFNIKTQLNPKFWKDGRLDSRIRMKLLDIADDFIEFLGVDWVKPDDVIITGSLANYNWNKKFSDIDLHILMDYSKVDKRTDFVDNYFYSQKKLWNDEHKDLKIFGFPVELYVQDTKEKHASTGVYSLDKDKWIREPEREKLSKSKINKSLIKNKVAEYIDKIDKLLTIYKGADSDYKIRKVSEDADKLFDEIKKERKSSLNNKEIEITNGNLIFKCLRRLGYIEKITTLMSDTYDKLNSLS